jgi:CBS domain-containing protein
MEKKVRDLMVPLSSYATVHADKSIREALEVLNRAQRDLGPNQHFHRSVLVLDGSGSVIGKLSHWAVLRSLEPRFLKFEDETALSRAGLTEEFIKSMQLTFTLFAGGLEQMCRIAARLKARDAMVPVRESIDEDMLLTEAIHQMVMKHVLSILVTKAGRVVGILRQSDVFTEVAGLMRSAES